MSDATDHKEENTHQGLLTGAAQSQRGKVGDNHQFTPRIRRYANEVVHEDKWPFEVDLSNVTFETRTRSKRQRGVCELKNRYTAI